jgi:hypothetical protein
MEHGKTKSGEDRRLKLIRLIHVGRGKLALTGDAYRALLRGATGKDSCAGMTVPELCRVLAAVKAAGFRAEKRMPLKAGETGKASPEQLAYLKGLWELAARVKTEKALAAFIRRIAHVDGIRFLDGRGAGKVILAVRDIAAKAGYDPDGVPGGRA